MAKRTITRHREFSEWEEFAGRHAGHPFLQHDPLYALSEPIIDAIKDEVPTFFAADQESFERDLIQTASFGFFHRRALGPSAAIKRPDPESGLSLQERRERTERDITEMLAEELRRDGLAKGEIDEYLQQNAGKREIIDARKDAYAGWLISNGQFHDEVGKLRSSWEPLVRKVGRFPTYPRWPFVNDLSRTAVPDEFRDACYGFYRRWGLDKMITWDWPVPMEPDFSVGMVRDLPLLSEAGLVLFVPWYLLRGDALNLQGVAQNARTACEAEHLWDWLHKHSGGKGEIGDIRFSLLRWIYRFHELVLMQRYGPVCKGHVEQLDQALATVINRKVDTVKKLRLELKRILHGR